MEVWVLWYVNDTSIKDYIGRSHPEGEVNSGSGSRGSRCKAQASTSLEATYCSKRKSPQGGRAGQRARDLPKQWTPLWKQAGARDSTPTCTCPPGKAHFNPVNAPLETASLSSPLTHGSVPASPRVPGMPGWGVSLPRSQIQRSLLYYAPSRTIHKREVQGSVLSDASFPPHL